MACSFLVSNGYIVLERNFRCRTGEIDIIAYDENVLSFIEVKYRKNADYGFPSEAVNHKKQNKIINASLFYLIKNGSANKTVRYDVVEIIGNKIRIIKNAFGG